MDGEHCAGADGDGELAARHAAPLPPFAGKQQGDRDDDQREAESPGGNGKGVRVREADQGPAERDADQGEGKDQRGATVLS